METPMPDMWLKTEVQIRSVDPSRIAIDWLKSEGFEVEMDRFRDTRMEVAEPAAGPIGPLDPEASARYHPLAHRSSSSSNAGIGMCASPRHRSDGAAARRSPCKEEE
jgi:hypothetical protein